MKARLSHLSPFALVVLSIPALIVIHTVWSVWLPSVMRMVVPETVRAVLHAL
jgi:hypothetical protein